MREIPAALRPFAPFVRLAGACRLAVAACALITLPPLRGAEVGETQVLKWKDGKKAVFLLAFDDSCPTHLTKDGLVRYDAVPGPGEIRLLAK